MISIIPGVAGQAHQLSKDMKDPRIAMICTGVTVTLLAVMALREIKHEIRDMLREHGKERGR